MIQDCFSPKISFRNSGSGKLRIAERAGLFQVRSQADTKIAAESAIKPNNITLVDSKSRLSSVSIVKEKISQTSKLRKYINSDNGFISATNILQDGIVYGKLSPSISINAIPHRVSASHLSYNDFENFVATEKLYPSGIEVSVSGFNIVSGSILDIDEGVIIGNYTKNGLDSLKVANDNEFLTAKEQVGKSSSDHDSYKLVLEMDSPTTNMSQSFLAMRIDAPNSNFRSRKSPIYKFHNLTFSDPSGNLIAKYKDFTVIGESDFTIPTKNATTYLTETLINNASLRTYDDGYPVFGEASGYLLNIEVDTSTIDDPFDSGFATGFSDENAPNSGRDEDFRIIAVEILAQGKKSSNNDISMDMFVEVPSTGFLTERHIFPSNLLKYDFENTIYPSGENSIWKTNNNSNFNYLEDNSYMSNLLRDNDNAQFIELVSTSDIADSGKLKLKFSHETPTTSFRYTNGAFEIGFGFVNFDTAGKQQVGDTDSFFVVEDLELKVVAKKATGSRDYVIDVVGYSDDKLLNITPKIGGFLQNASGEHPSGIGVMPVSSGFASIDDLALSAESFSDKFQYFESSGTNNLGGDHYSLPLTPIVNTTEFAEYTVPLKIYADNVSLGRSTDYSMSSYFENLYLDIFPFPSGAAISKVSLLVKYKPSNALLLHTVGHESKELHRANIKAYPSSAQSFDRKLNSIVQESGLSLIESIPHGYQSPSTIKTNYSRRWRGSDGNVMVGPFQQTVFDFSFYNPQLNAPFLNGHFDFNEVDGNFILPNQQNILSDYASGYFNGTMESSVIENLGLRFNSSGLFTNQQRAYKTIDWTQSGHELDGKILDSFDKSLRVSGSNGNVNFGSGISTSGGFSAYIRFSPDVSVSGSSYNLWNSGVLLSKWDSGKDLEFAIAYSGGFLAGYARDTSNNIIDIYDSQDYTNYQYPLSVLLTYNDNLSNKLKLYVDSEIASGNHNILRASSSSFVMDSGNSDIVAGFSSGSGVGIHAFITDIGLSSHNASGTNVLESGVNLDVKQTNAESFFSSIRSKFWNTGENASYDTYKLGSFVDENTDKWHIGDFQNSVFDFGFDRYTLRIGRDYITFKLNHDGLPYSQRTDLELPSSEINTSGLAYHTQIENDMLRLDISTIPDGDSHRLYSAAPRISKNLPRGYTFAESAFVVDTILQSNINTSVSWPDGNVGPKLIVSLYAPQKDPTQYTAKNFGLVNRHYHYLPSGNDVHKISSTFDYNDWIDKTEPWSEFNTSTATTEFSHKFYSDDIDKMFIQYDLAFPSGDPFNSLITLHSVNLNLKDALASGDIVNASNFTLYTSGDTVTYNNVELFVDGLARNSGILNLYSSGAAIPSVSADVPSGFLMSILAYDQSTVDTISNNNLSFFTSGDGIIGFNPDLVISEGMFGVVNTDFNPVVNLFVNGKTTKDSIGQLSLSVSNDGVLPESSSSINLFNSSIGKLAARTIEHRGIFRAFIHGIENPVNDISRSIPLYVANVKPEYIPSGSLNLSVTGSTILPDVASNLNLFTTNYTSSIGQVLIRDNQAIQFINWTNTSVGTGILTTDNPYSYLESNDEIRGVDLICYGDCSYTSEKCSDDEITIHGQNFGQECVDGGIFRAKRLYTNLSTSGFKTDTGYENNFYGIRKLTGLNPYAPYNVKITGRTAGEIRKELPRSLSIEYGFSDTVNFSGIKLIADGISGASGTVAPLSTTPRNAYDKYGKSVKVHGDYLVVGSPYHNAVDYLSTGLGDAGTVFLYKRNPAPSGFDWSNQDDKSGFSFVSELTLPQGLNRDYSVTSSITELNDQKLPFATPLQNWYNIGENRNLGYSVDLSSSGNSPTIVVGAPNSRFSRTFSDPVPTPIEVALFVFTRPFEENKVVDSRKEQTVIKGLKTYRDILPTLTNTNFLYQYYSTPAVSVNVKIIVVEPNLNSGPVGDEEFYNGSEGIAYKYRISNHETGNFFGQTRTTKMVRQLQEIFHGPVSGVYQYDVTKPNNNIPVIVGALVDDSISMGEEVLGIDGSNALDQFFGWYKSYSLASGVTNFEGDPSAGSTFKYTVSRGADWIENSISLINKVFDTGRMLSSEDYKLFSSNIGTFNSNTAKFNVAPPSGGAVFVFEQESNDGVLEWNPIQKIDSPTTSRNIHPDRFGHDVAISDDKSTIVVGSPYMNQAVRIYEKNNLINPVNYVGSWINRVGQEDAPFGYLRDKYRRYQELLANFGTDKANLMLFDELNASGKFQLRLDENIQPYELVKEYNYYDMMPGGNWTWLYRKFAPTPRLGYSIDVNEDGSIVAAGAPTDSVVHKEFNDFNLWWRPSRVHTSQWFSSVNAGSVTVFESRKYYPHNNKVVEYTRFGNHHRNLNINEHGSGLFNHMKAIYATQGLSFERLPEDEVDIPNDAGLAFIITPAVDALSDEILDNIQDWLGLGDRHLVLVSDDPIYENNGAYQDTNNIVNKILSKLDSRMEIVPARNEYEALIGSNRKDNQPFNELDSNIQPSFIPSKTTEHRHFRVSNLRGSGVADIKLNYPGIYDAYSCEEPPNDPLDIPELGKRPAYQDINLRCNMIPQHGGDLRAQWTDACFSGAGSYRLYPRNLAFAFGTFTTCSFGCCADDIVESATKNYEPIPLLVANEHVVETQKIPAIPESTEQESVVVGYKVVETPVFSDNPLNEAYFYWDGSGNNYISKIDNLGSSNSPSAFITDPDIVLSKTNLLRSEAHAETQSVNVRNPIGSYTYIAKQKYENTTSEVYIIGGTDTETRRFLFEAADDSHLAIYRSLLYKVGDNINTPSDEFLDNIAVLGGWTNRTTFKDGRDDSYLEEHFATLPPKVTYNVNDLENNINTSTYDALWIANTDQLITGTDLRILQDWLLVGNRKLFITCGKTSSLNNETFLDQNISLDNVNALDALISGLNLDIKIMRLPVKNKIASSSDFFPLRQDQSFTAFGEISYNILNNHRDIDLIFDSSSLYSSLPIDIRDGGVKLLSTTGPLITDDKFEIPDVPYFKTGVAKITFPVLPGSGYRLFIDTMSTDGNEKNGFYFQISNCAMGYGVLSSGGLDSIRDYTYKPNTPDNHKSKIIAQDYIGAKLGNAISTFGRKSDGTTFPFAFDGSINTQEIDIYIPSGDGSDHDNVNKIDHISIYIDSNNLSYPVKLEGYDSFPKTQRLVGISGVLLPAEIKTTQTPVFDFVDRIIPGVPERTLTISESRAISTESIKYCPTDICTDIFTDKNPDDKIEDGPVVAAQEIYFQRPFDVGVARSRITVLTDASMIQGKRIANNDGVISSELITFLTSLYPVTEFPLGDNTSEFAGEISNKTYNIINKITAPVKGSPHKFFNSTGNSGIMIRFAGDGTPATSGRAMSFFSDTIDPNTLDQRYGGPKSVLPIDVADGAKEYLDYMPPPYPDAEGVELLKRAQIAAFDSAQYSYGGTARFSGVIDGTMYTDAFYGEMPQLIKDKGYDYLDFDKLPSGYPGDLFGYSVALNDNKLLVGSPFAAFSSETPISWDYVSGITVQYEQASGTVLSYGGGAGSAFLYGRGDRVLDEYGVTDGSSSWNLIRKIRPNSINVGQDLNDPVDASGSEYLGSHNYSEDDLRQLSYTTDQFGSSVDMNDDVIIIGAPGHDFGNYEEMLYERGAEASGAFNHKEFNNSIDIPARTVYDLGESGVRSQLYMSGSGVNTVLNNGAVYVYESNVGDWEAKTKNWVFTQKLIPQGYSSRDQADIATSGSENDYYGTSVSVYQNPRSDSDYTIAVGAPNHMFATSGNHDSFDADIDTGSVYISDAILREPSSTLPDPEASMFAIVYGNSGINRAIDSDDYISLYFTNSGVYDYNFESSGTLYSNENGEIFLEASGYDPATRSFSAHRPLIQEITGKSLVGELNTGVLHLFASGQGPLSSGKMPLYNQGNNSAVVYNNLGLYATSMDGSVSGVFAGSGLNIHLDARATVYNNLGLYITTVDGSVSGVFAGSGLSMYINATTTTTTTTTASP